MKRSLVVFLALASVACVPSTAELAPRGAAGARFVPNAIAKGAPFTTADGWTVTIERLALIALLTAQGSEYGYGGGYVAWDGARKAEAWAPGLAAGPSSVRVEQQGVFISSDSESASTYDPFLSGSKLPADLMDRLLHFADNPSTAVRFSSSDVVAGEGPAIVFAARAERGAETMKLGLALARSFQLYRQEDALSVAVDVPANDVLFSEYEVRPERIFAAAPGANGGTTFFDPLADADRKGNHDGIIDAAELHSVSVLSDDAVASLGCEDPATGYLLVECKTLLDQLADNALHLLAPIGIHR